MNYKDLKYAMPNVNMKVIEQFDGNLIEQKTLFYILSEWNSRLSISNLCKKWKKERPSNAEDDNFFLLFNCEGLSTHGADIDILLSSYTPKITILTGVGKQIRNLRSVPGYYWEFSFGDNSFGGVAILIHHSIKSKVIEKAENFLMLEIQTMNDTALVGGVYVPPRKRPPLHLFEKYLDKNFIIFGDFNAKHAQWNCDINNTSGNQLKDWLDRNGCDLVHSSKPTSKRSESIIDFAITFDGSGWKAEVLNEGTSDHFPVLFTSPLCLAENCYFRKTNWKIFSFVLKSIFEYWNSIVYNLDHESFFILFSDFLSSLWDRCSIFELSNKFRPPWPHYPVAAKVGGCGGVYTPPIN
jgi:hypothetical protein